MKGKNIDFKNIERKNIDKSLKKNILGKNDWIKHVLKGINID